MAFLGGLIVGAVFVGLLVFVFIAGLNLRSW
jgi:hypothetical protein